MLRPQQLGRQPAGVGGCARVVGLLLRLAEQRREVEVAKLCREMLIDELCMRRKVGRTVRVSSWGGQAVHVSRRQQGVCTCHTGALCTLAHSAHQVGALHIAV